MQKEGNLFCSSCCFVLLGHSLLEEQLKRQNVRWWHCPFSPQTVLLVWWAGKEDQVHCSSVRWLRHEFGAETSDRWGRLSNKIRYGRSLGLSGLPSAKSKLAFMCMTTRQLSHFCLMGSDLVFLYIVFFLCMFLLQFGCSGFFLKEDFKFGWFLW